MPLIMSFHLTYCLVLWPAGANCVVTGKQLYTGVVSREYEEGLSLDRIRGWLPLGSMLMVRLYLRTLLTG